ncbi:MAG: hypothetical protein AAFX99_01360, partial [Myxococcota bacterium]
MTTERRDFGPVAGQMREALEKYTREELADLLTHIVRVYVIEGKEPQLSEGGKVSPEESLKTLTFSQLILHLQMNLPHAELKRLRVSGERVWAERNGSEVLIAGEPQSDERPPDWDDIGGEPAQRSNPPRAPGVRAATGPIRRSAPEEPVVPAPGTPRRRRAEPEVTPTSVAQESNRVARPNVGLREEPTPVAPRERPAPRDWFKDAGSSKTGGSGDPEDEVGERSDR